MRTNEERIDLINKRTSELRKKRHARNTAALHSLSLIACISVIVGSGLAVNNVEIGFEAPPLGRVGAASVLSQNPAVGYILMAIMAFSLGVCMTLFFFHMDTARKAKHSSDSEDKDEL